MRVGRISRSLFRYSHRTPARGTCDMPICGWLELGLPEFRIIKCRKSDLLARYCRWCGCIMRRKIERNRTAARQAKKFHGTRCQACDRDFAERYGEIGRDFIEAHHLRPIATLEEGVPVKYDVAADFAVLCSNCHRMIHRFANPSDVQSFRASIL